MATYLPKREVVVHDEAPSGIDDHPYEPRGAWWSLCKHCGFAQAAHKETTLDPRDHPFEGERNSPMVCEHCGGAKSEHNEIAEEWRDHIWYPDDD